MEVVQYFIVFICVSLVTEVVTMFHFSTGIWVSFSVYSPIYNHAYFSIGFFHVLVPYVFNLATI